MITDSTLETLEFHKLLFLIAGHSHSDTSRQGVLNIRPLGSREEIELRLAQIQEIRRLAGEGKPLPFTRFSDISHLLRRIRPEGSVLEPRELSDFIPFLGVLTDISDQLRENTSCPHLKELTRNLTGHPVILTKLTRSIDSEGHILDDASPQLSDLRNQVRVLESAVKKKLEEMVREESLSVFLQDTFVTQRSGRWVIPVRMDAKGQVPGVVHDISRTGETAFVEPLHIINLSNRLENLVAEGKAEEIRILRKICSMLRDAADDMDGAYNTLVYLDILNSIALFSDQLRMEPPQLNETNSIALAKARHPLMVISFSRSGSGHHVVPLDIRLGGTDSIMVITGANAGGKTIAVKTVGLLIVMALSGMPVPADASSSFPLASNILVDIGDEQSIEDSLSTFSAHVSNIAEILELAGPRSLVLLDELGTGTDPDEGTAIACAVLKELRQRGSLVFATTHLTGIKGFVHLSEGMINAAMEFDQKTLTPLYRLRVGEPGQSHGLEIATKYGLPDSIITSAKEMLGGLKVEFEELVADLNEKRSFYEKAVAELSRQVAEVAERDSVLRQKISDMEVMRKDVMGKAYREAADILLSVKRELHALLKEAKRSDASRMREIIRQVVSRQEETAQKITEFEGTGESPLLNELEEGDVVFVKSLGYDAVVVKIDIKHNRVRLRTGNREIDVPVPEISQKRGITFSMSSGVSPGDEAGAPAASNINLIGSRVDEAISALEPFLNHASLSGLAEVTIIHGHGTGILSRTVREHLTRHPLVKQFRGGTPSEGGNGVTVVTLA